MALPFLLGNGESVKEAYLPSLSFFNFIGDIVKKIILAIMTVLAFSSFAFAHSGGRDAYGGHYDKSAGKYHVHEGPLEGRTYNNQENMLKALKKAKGGPEIIKKVEQEKKSNK